MQRPFRGDQSRQSGFGPESLSLLDEILEQTWSELNCSGIDEPEVLRRKLAKQIITAAEGERDPTSIKLTSMKTFITKVINDKLHAKGPG
jgi:hypothetical protein